MWKHLERSLRGLITKVNKLLGIEERVAIEGILLLVLIVLTSVFNLNGVVYHACD